MRIPLIGEMIYIPTQLYISHGEDDVTGGLATINKIKVSDYLPKGHHNSIMVGVKEVKGTLYGWSYLLEHQEKWSEEYKGKVAHPDPDYNDYGERR